MMARRTISSGSAAVMHVAKLQKSNSRLQRELDDTKLSLLRAEEEKRRLGAMLETAGAEAEGHVQEIKRLTVANEEGSLRLGEVTRDLLDCQKKQANAMEELEIVREENLDLIVQSTPGTLEYMSGLEMWRSSPDGLRFFAGNFMEGFRACEEEVLLAHPDVTLEFLAKYRPAGEVPAVEEVVAVESSSESSFCVGPESDVVNSGKKM